MSSAIRTRALPGDAGADAAVERADRPLIELRAVAKDYASGAGVVRALRDVNLAIMAGEFVAVVGTSGSGKSTLMNILGCLDRPTEGVYGLAGLDVEARSNDARALVRNRLIGFVFQGFNLLARTTALENCELPLQYRGVRARERRRRAMAALKAVGLGDRMYHTSSQLSGGQQQRVAIARALVTDPPLLLADEPTGNLDTRTSLEVLALLQQLNRERHITVVVVTHEPGIAACASRVLTTRDGRIVSDERHDPVDAAQALAALEPSPPEPKTAAHLASRGARQGALRPLPVSLYLITLGAGLFGALAGVAYNRWVIAQSLVWVPVTCALLAEAWTAARYGGRVLGGPLSADERARFAAGYTVATCSLLVPVAWMAVPRLPAAMLERIEQLSSSGIALALLMLSLALGGVVLLRYLLLTVCTPRPQA